MRCTCTASANLFEVSGDRLFEEDRLHEEETARLIGDALHQLYFRYEDSVSSGNPMIYLLSMLLGVLRCRNILLCKPCMPHSRTVVPEPLLLVLDSVYVHM